MIDIHAHILPDVDDGPETVEESIAILRAAAEQNITGIIATPHFKINSYKLSSEEINRKVELLQRKVETKGFNINIMPGAEVRITQNLAQKASTEEIPTLNNTDYMLIELPMDKIPHYTDHVLYDLKVMGYKPVICHPERNKRIIKEPSYIENWIEAGIYIQINASSLLGVFGKNAKNTAFKLINKNLFNLLASDAHSTNNRKIYLKEGLNLIKQATGYPPGEVMENSFRLINNKKLENISKINIKNNNPNNLLHKLKCYIAKNIF